MPQEVSSVYGPDSQPARAEPVLRIGNREIFWRPRHLRPSRWLEHLPFLFWLIADLRPRRCVTLGLDTGVAHFALCQGVEKLGLEALCLGVDARDGVTLPDALLRYNEDHYDDFSRLIADAEAPGLTAEELDLLVVDRPLSARLLAQLTNEWAPRLRPGGVMVLTGLEAPDTDTARALAGMQARHPHVRFDHGGGLVMLCHGTDAASPAARRVRRLAALDPASPEHHVVHQVFRRLGQLNAAAHHADSESSRARQLEAELHQRAREQAAVEAALEELRDQHGTLNEAYDARHAHVAGIEAELFDLRAALDSRTAQDTRLQAELETARTTASRLQAQLDARDRDLQALRDRQAEMAKMAEARDIKARDAEIARLSEQLAARDTALAEMAAQLDSARQENTTLHARAEERTAEIATLSRKLDKALATRDALRKRIDLLVNSTSWRVTAPLRRVKTALSGSGEK